MNNENELNNFLLSLTQTVDYGRLERAISMFRKSKNVLFVRKEEDGLAGIIKSQTSDERDYSIIITSKGFSCGTQNLRVCGGLRGHICKHIILGFIAGIKGGILSEKDAMRLIKSAASIKPIYDKSKSSSIFHEYENFKQGNIDWRPVEIFPEDLMAY